MAPMGRGMERKAVRNLRVFAWIGFIIYLIAMVYFLFFSEEMGRVSGADYRYNIKPLAEIKRCVRYMDMPGMQLNLFGNVICFMPLGFVLPVLRPRRWGFFRVACLSFLASVLVEIIQLVTKLGSCDVDDVILNTCGGMAGWLLFFLCKKCYDMFQRRQK